MYICIYLFLSMLLNILLQCNAPPTLFFYTTPATKGCLEEIALSDKAALLYMLFFHLFCK